MAVPTERHDVRAEIGRFVRGEVSLRDVAIWLAERKEEPLTPDALDLVRTVQLVIGEYSGGHIDRPRLVVRLADLLAQEQSQPD